MMVRLVEVGPRDGLQNEGAPVATAEKVSFVERLAAAGLRTIEVSAFVSPRWVPQMADADEVFARITRREGVKYTALAPNLRGLSRALESRADEVAVFAAASEGFSQRNINQTIEQSLRSYTEVCEAAKQRGLPVRAYLSTAFGCPFDGYVDPGRVAELTARLLDMGAYEVAVSDTIGIAHPGQVRSLTRHLLSGLPAERLALHFHDTRGTALANVLAAIDLGIRTFDASAGGLGGCPYAPGATGNLATEDLVYMLDGLGEATGVDLDALVGASLFIQEKVGHPLPSRVLQAKAHATYVFPSSTPLASRPPSS